MKYNYQIKIEYLGTNFVGWQIQKNGKSVQEIIQKALTKTFKTKKNLRRTGYAGSFVAGLELVREGDLIIKQNKLFDKIYLKIKK